MGGRVEGVDLRCGEKGLELGYGSPTPAATAAGQEGNGERGCSMGKGRVGVVLSTVCGAEAGRDSVEAHDVDGAEGRGTVEVYGVVRVFGEASGLEAHVTAD